VLANCLSELRDLERDPKKLEPATETPYPRVRYGETIRQINKSRAGGDPVFHHHIEKYGHTEDQVLELFYRGDSEVWRTMTAESAEELGYISEEQSTSHGEDIRLRILPFKWGDDFGAPDETIVGLNYDRPVFVTNFPIEIKGFYFKDELGADGAPVVDPVFAALPEHLKTPGASGHTVLGADLIGPEGAGEMIGGSQREDDYARLVEKIHHHQLPEEFFQWYLDTRRFGNVPHSGFGIGLERFLCWVCGGSDNPVHIREAITFPRMLHQLEP
jgi:aspartyl/asparaginyl-tRNA synthetase